MSSWQLGLKSSASTLKPKAVTPLRAWWFHQWARWVKSTQSGSSHHPHASFFRGNGTLMTFIWYRFSTDTGNWLDHGLTKTSQLCSLIQISKKIKKWLVFTCFLSHARNSNTPSVSSLHQSPPDGKMDFTAAQVAPAEVGSVVDPFRLTQFSCFVLTAGKSGLVRWNRDALSFQWLPDTATNTWDTDGADEFRGFTVSHTLPRQALVQDEVSRNFRWTRWTTGMNVG